MKQIKIFKSSIFKDHRGHLWTSWKKNRIKLNFIHDKFSISKKNTLRGLHGDKKTWKLVQCLYGEIYFVVVDFRENSPTYKHCESFTLSSKNRMQILIPPGCLNGTLCLSNESIFSYKQSEIYSGSENQFSIRWNDPKLNITWPSSNPILSLRDAEAKLL